MDREAILKLKEERPNTVGQVRKLTWFLGYYRKYIQNYARRVKPLYDLLQNSCDKNSRKPTKHRKGGNNNAQLPSGQTVIWTDKHQKAVNEIVDILLTPQVMAYPNFEKPFILHVDAFLDGLGAVLYQRQDSGKLAVVAYASRTLMTAEKNYHAGKLEFLALKLAILRGFKTTYYTLQTSLLTVTTILIHCSLWWVQQTLMLRDCDGCQNWQVSVSTWNINLEGQTRYPMFNWPKNDVW